jgi:sarcosine oxidase subunit alpha
MRINKVGSKGQAINRGEQVQIIINDKPVIAYAGELVSTVLQAEGIQIFNRKHKTGNPSGIYCGMGICYECLVTINGIPNIRACQTIVENSMIINTANEEKL